MTLHGSRIESGGILMTTGIGNGRYASVWKMNLKVNRFFIIIVI